MHRNHVLAFLILLIVGCLPAAIAAPVSLAISQDHAIGLDTSFLEENAARLDLNTVIAAQRSGQFQPGQSEVLNFGIGSKPVWIHFKLNNPTPAPLARRLSIETAWLDRVDFYLYQPGKSVVYQHAGDEKPFTQRSINSRYFVFESHFPPGVSEVFMRINTPDPMVVPIHVLSHEMARSQESRQELSYGLVYGFLLALIAYNTMLYLSLRSANYLFYSLYLAMFAIMNIAYTGHGFAWLWPESIKWQQWSNPVLMLLYGFSGLLFATRFLDIKQHFPRFYSAVLGFCLLFGGAFVIAYLSGSQMAALAIAFTFAFLFSLLMLLLGMLAVHAAIKPARYFLFASVSAMVGAALTTLSTSGFIPYNGWTFRAVEIGMLIDATLLALALSYQFRMMQEDKIHAEQLSLLDPLTGLNNRRAFYQKADPVWSTALRKGRDAAVISIDIDHFKLINDSHGHIHGDEALIAVAHVLKRSIRLGDILARWGGEEFIVFMPETSLEEAAAMAERLRAATADIRIRHASGYTVLTASLGVAQKGSGHDTLDMLISAADNAMYTSKQQGRNQVSFNPPD